MPDITRRSRGEETLTIHLCPVCNGDVRVSDCGYTTFNPGKAECLGCSKAWKLGFVNDQWDAGIAWNKKACAMAERVAMLRFIKMRFKRVVSTHRDFQNEAMEEAAIRFIDDEINKA